VSIGTETGALLARNNATNPLRYQSAFCFRLFDLPKVHVSLRSLPNDRGDAGEREISLRIITEPRVPEHVNVELARLSACEPAEIRFQKLQVLAGDLACYDRIPIRLRIAVLLPDAGLHLVAAHFADTADSRIAIAGFEHAQRLQAGQPGLRHKNASEENRKERLNHVWEIRNGKVFQDVLGL
jgi:hypothetical protein